MPSTFKKDQGLGTLRQSSGQARDQGSKNINDKYLIQVRSPWSVVRGPLFSQSGIALLLVMSAIVVLTMLAVEFAYNAQVEYHLALKQKERLEAYYLAQSAYRLTLLELKMGSAVQSQVASATKEANIKLNVDLSAPLCEQFPIKTDLFRMAVGEDQGPGTRDQGLKTEEERPLKTEGASQAFAGLPLSGLQEFLQFEGDFDAECKDESSKIDLNFFYTQDPSKKVAEGQDNAYDAYKKFLIRFLSAPKFRELTEKKDVSIPDVVRNIADWIDPNDIINEWGGGQGGLEESVYRGEAFGPWAIKNGKLSTPGDIYRIAGIDEEWWDPLALFFTIYGMTDEKGNPQINVCRAPNEVVEALILRYLETRKDLPPMPADNVEMMKELVNTVKQGCTGARPDKSKIASDLDAKLLELLKVAPLAEVPPEKGQAGYAPPSSVFADWIATATKVYSMELKGQVKDTVVTIHAVIDMGGEGASDPNKWKLVYWKIE